MYGLHVDLVATTAEGGDILEHLDLVAGQLGEIEDGNEALLDFTLGADGGTGAVEVDVTVEAASPEAAMAEGISWIRSAIHAADAGTPGWDNAAPSVAELVEYHLGEATTTPLVRA